MNHVDENHVGENHELWVGVDLIWCLTRMVCAFASGIACGRPNVGVLRVLHTSFVCPTWVLLCTDRLESGLRVLWVRSEFYTVTIALSLIWKFCMSNQRKIPCGTERSTETTRYCEVRVWPKPASGLTRIKLQVMLSHLAISQLGFSFIFPKFSSGTTRVRPGTASWKNQVNSFRSYFIILFSRLFMMFSKSLNRFIFILTF